MVLQIQATLAGQLNIDICRFKSGDEHILVELYVDIARSSITHKPENGILFGSVLLNASIFKDNILLSRDVWRIVDKVDSTVRVGSGQRIIDARQYQVSEGNFDIQVTAVDSLSTERWQESTSVNAMRYQGKELALSDIELAGSIFAAETPSKFNKSGYALVPNPRRLFGVPDPSFIYYIEIYPTKSTKTPVDYQIHRSIIDVYGRESARFEPIIRNGGPGSLADIDVIEFDDLSTGTYTFEIVVKSPEGPTARQSKRFYVYLPGTEATLTVPVPDSMNVIRELTEIEFLLTREQVKILKKKSLEEKSYFLEAFWRGLDNDLSTKEIPKRQQFRTRVSEADVMFRTDRMPGRRTARGRVYVLYGEPDIRRTFPMEINAKPYEIWTFDRFGGEIEFVFVDRSGMGEYRLIHSNMAGEINNPDWYEDYITKTEAGAKR